MASVAVDLSPVVSALLERPFDQPSLDRAYAAVSGHPQAYATALRCAAKKTRDPLAAAYWFVEAARVHESMDDIGGAIALLFRALECDRANPRPRELLAAAMVRLSVRSGLGFSFTPGATPLAPQPLAATLSEQSPVATGLRPPSLERFRYTEPSAFGGAGEGPGSDKRPDAFGDDDPVTGTALRATLPSAVLRPVAWTGQAGSGPLEPDGDRVDQLLPPPKNSSESGVVHVTRSTSGEPILRSIVEATVPPLAAKPVTAEVSAVPLAELAEAPKADVPATPEGVAVGPTEFPEAGPKMTPMPSVVIGPEAKSAETTTSAAGSDMDAAPPTTRAPAFDVEPQSTTAKTGDEEKDVPDLTDDAEPADEHVVKPRPVPPSRAAKRALRNESAPPSAATPSSPTDDVYAEDKGPPTLRPAGDRLVGGIFEALHGLHFLPDVRQAAAFVCRTLSQKMRPATALVHLYDINSGHFLVVSAEGHRAAALLDYPTPEDDAFIAEVMTSDESTLVSEPSADPRFTRGRWALIEPKLSVLCAPVVSERRSLGLLEVVDPFGGGAFTDDDKNALTYAASALSRFIGRRGLVLSDEPERSSPDAAAV